MNETGGQMAARFVLGDARQGLMKIGVPTSTIE